MEPGQAPDPKVVPFPAAPGAMPGVGSGAGSGAATALSEPDRNALAALIRKRVRALQAICGAMLGSVGLLAAAGPIVARLAPAPPRAATGLSLTLTSLAAVLILATSRVQAWVLARAGRGSPATGPARAGEVVGAYVRATAIAFALLDAAAVLGLGVAAVTATGRYALVICAVAVLGMLARWPRRVTVYGLLRRRRLT
jgi:hypothetical protein